MLRKLVNQINPFAKKKVLILSFGGAGSFWLGQTLHKDPNIYCSVGGDHPLSGIRYWHNPDDIELLIQHLKKNAALREYGFSRGHMAVNGQKISSYSTMEAQGVSIPERIADPSSILLQENMLVAKTIKPSARIIANVHGMHALSYQTSPYKKDTSIKCFDLIRHPISTMETWKNAFLWMWEHCPHGKKQLENRFHSLAEQIKHDEIKYKVDLSEPYNMMAYFTHIDIQTIANAFSLVNCERVTFESLKYNSDAFSNFYQKITGKKPGKAYLDFVYSSENASNGRVSQSAKATPPANPQEQYQRWSDFEKTLISHTVKHTNFSVPYQHYGYDLSFI